MTILRVTLRDLCENVFIVQIQGIIIDCPNKEKEQHYLSHFLESESLYVVLFVQRELSIILENKNGSVINEK